MAIGMTLVLLCLVAFLIEPTICFNPKNASSSFFYDWAAAGATWYGEKYGDGSEGGACEYGAAVGKAPIGSMIAAGGPSIFKAGQGCGACYQVKCTGNPACSGKPVMMVITDECPGGPCLSDSIHFDMSGTAFGAMAIPGRDDELRNAGAIQIQYTRAQCNYPGSGIAFHVDTGSNPYYFAVVPLFVAGDGELRLVELLPSWAEAQWLPMQHLDGVGVWKLNWSSPVQPPFSLRLTAMSSGKVLTVQNVIPGNWKPGTTYQSSINF